MGILGDNILTAISVSKECGLVHPHSRVFVPRIVDVDRDKFTSPNGFDSSREVSITISESLKHDSGSRRTIVWECTETGETLDSRTLELSGNDPPLSSTSSAASMEEEYQKTYNTTTVLQKLHIPAVRSGFPSSSPPILSSRKVTLAVSGDAFEVILLLPRELLARILYKASIFARMSPDQKHVLVEQLQEVLEHCVGFCGDGANDCGALKAADVGLSLSEAEASVAAPFTSHDTDLQCVLRVVREGRAALVTSFSCFKYMALYSMIQFTSVVMLYSNNSNLGDAQFLYIDLFMIMPIAVFSKFFPFFHGRLIDLTVILVGYSGPYKDIHRKPPTSSLISRKILVSVLGQVIIQVCMQLWVYFWVKRQPWYVLPLFLILLRKAPINAYA